MNFVKLIRIFRPVNGHTGKSMETIYKEIWVDTFQIYSVEIHSNHAVVLLKPMQNGFHPGTIDISLESLPALERALEKHNLPW